MTVVLNWQDKADLLRYYWDVFGPFRFVIETGVWQGNGSAMQFSDRAEYVAIEKNEESARMARAKGWDVRTGDSAEMLPWLLSSRNEPALFWLDAHDSKEGGDETSSTPLLAELEAILAWPHAAGSVVLVDDMRCCEWPEWPDLRQVFDLVDGVWAAVVQDDILRCVPW